MAISAECCKVFAAVVVVIRINMMNFKLAFIFWHKPATLAKFLHMPSVIWAGVISEVG